MNTEIRDHLNFLKGWADKVTGSTTADTGTAIKMQIIRTAITETAYETQVSGDSTMRLSILASGKLEWTNGATTTGLVNLYKNGADILATDDDFTANTVETTGGVIINGTSAQALLLDGGGGIEFVERTDPGAPGGNRADLYVRDNGAGKKQLVVKFSAGAVKVLATQD